MTGLLEWQRALQAHILDGGMTVSGLLATDTDQTTGLDIYVEAYRNRLLEALTSLYPGLQALAGDTVLLRFIAEHPPRVANLRWYGGALAEWLRSRKPPCPAVWPAMAELEWALAMVYEVGDVALAHRGDLAGLPAIDWPRLVLRPVPGWRLLRLPADLVARRHLLLDGLAAGDLIPAGPVVAEHDGVLPFWVIWRQGLVVQQRVLGAEEAVLAQALQDGESLARLCERLACLHPAREVPARLLGWIELWLGQAWLGAIELPPHPA